MNQPLQVLYVEDDDDIRELAEFALEDEGFDLVPCASGQEALTAAAGFEPDLLLLDVMMPGLDGPSTLRRLRQMPHLTRTAVIFMTAKAQSSEIAHYMGLGAAGVITKPFDALTLADQIRGILTGDQT